MTQIAVTIMSALLSGLLATIVTININKRSENLKLKQNLAMDIFGYRYQLGNANQSLDINSKGFAKAMNCVPIVFHKDKKVLEAYDKFYETLTIADKKEKSSKSQEALIGLLKELCTSAKIDCAGWNDSRFERTFNI